MTTLAGKIIGTEAPSEFWSKVQIPVIQVNAPAPKFYESGYASGHANEDLAVPGLLDKLKELQGEPDTDQAAHTHYHEHDGLRLGHCWTHVQWSNRKASVFLHHVYDGRKDVYAMSN